ncbi:MAG: polymer-forming cytoskeletal protein [Rhodothermales bacterium]|nr:polymer-forming cytoskeletal protein [Rhodothermales bacterium]
MAKQPTPPTSSTVPGQINMIGEGTVVEGTLKADSDIRISGRVVGKVEVDGKVIIAQEGSVDGDLIATNADVAGSVEGHINVSGRLILKSTARIDAEIKTNRLVVEEGAVFEGQCEMGKMTSVKATDIKTSISNKPKTDDFKAASAG